MVNWDSTLGFLDFQIIARASELGCDPDVQRGSRCSVQCRNRCRPVVKAFLLQVLPTNSHQAFSCLTSEKCGKIIVSSTSTSIWSCYRHLVLPWQNFNFNPAVFFRHLDWIWAVEDWGFLFCLIGIGYCDLGVCHSLSGSLDMIWGAFYFAPHLIPGRPFSPCVMSQVTLMGKAVALPAKSGSWPWENRNWHETWSQWTNLQPWPIFSWKSIRWP